MQLDLSKMTVDYKAVGFEGNITVADLPEATVLYALVYGIRRVMQDGANSEAHKLAKERGLENGKDLPEEDRKTIHDARLGAMKDGTLGVPRTRAVAGLEPELARFLQEMRPQIKAKLDAKAYKAADAKEREAMLVAWIKEQPEAMQDRMIKKGAELLEQDAERAKEMADFI